MADHKDSRERSTNQPMHGPRKPLTPALLAVLALVVAIVLVFALITWVRYAT